MTLSEAEMRQDQITPEMIRFLKKFALSRLHILDLFVSQHSFVSHINYRKIMRHNETFRVSVKRRAGLGVGVGVGVAVFFFSLFNNNNNNNICIYILLIYLCAILSFAWLTGYAMRPVLLSDTVHSDSFTGHNNIASWEGFLIIFHVINHHPLQNIGRKGV